MIGKVLLSSLAVQALGCITLEAANSNVLGLRQGGNFGDSPLLGCNRLGCSTDKAGSRLQLKADDELVVQAMLHQNWEGGQVKYELKYGNRPNFDTTPGFEIEQQDPHLIAEGSATKDLVKRFNIEPAYNGNATIQISYVTAGLVVDAHPSLGDDVKDFESPRSVFVQCLDIEITSGGLQFPAGTFLNGFGPSENDDATNPKPPYRGGGGNGGVNPVDPRGTSPPPEEGSSFLIMAVLLSLLAVCLLVGVAMCVKRNKGQEPVKSDPIVHDVISVPKAPSVSRKAEKTPTPAEDLESEVAVGIHYETDPDTPPKSRNSEAATPKLEATGSMGRHFHFRYVEDDEN